MPRRGRRRIVAALAATLALAAAAPVGARDREASVRSAAAPEARLLLPARAPAALASLRRGVDLWLEAELTAGGAPVVAPARAALAPAAEPRGPEALDRALEAAGASRALLPILSFEAGEAAVALRIHPPPDGAVAPGVRRSGPLVHLGALLAETVAQLLDLPGPPAAPELSELSRLHRAAEALEAGDPVAAWRALEGAGSRAAARLRDDIARRADAGALEVAARSRLASLRGEADRDWLHVRQGIADGTDPELLLAGAASARAQQDAERALRLYDAVIELAPERAEAHLGRARALADAGRIEEARAAFARAAELAPEDPEPLEGLAGLADLDPEVRGDAWLRAGARRARRLEPGRARAAFEAAGRADAARRGEARLGVARLEEELGRPAEALQAYEEAASLRGDDPELWAGLGRARASAGDAEGAEEAFEKALALRPEDPGALRDLGGVLLEGDRPARAAEVLRAAVDAEPADARARRHLARAYRLQGDPEAALAVLDPSAVPPAVRSGVLADAAELELERGRTEEAASLLERAVAVAPTDPEVHRAAAALHRARGDEAAARLAQRAVTVLGGREVAPTSAPAAGEPGAAAGGIAAGEDADALFTEAAALAESFPAARDGEGAPWEGVLYLGLVEEGGVHAFLRRWLLPRRLDPGALDARVIEALGARFPLVPPPEVPDLAASALARVRAFSTSRGDIALVNDVLGVDAAFVGRLARSPNAHPLDPDGVPLTLELRMVSGRSEGEVAILANGLRIRDAAGLVGWNRRAALPYGLLLVLLSLPLVRGWGGLRVKLEYEARAGSKGFFSIQISRRPARARFEARTPSQRSKAGRYTRRVRSWSRFSRHMVDRDTLFRFIPARRYYVVVHGLLQDAASGEVIGNYLEETAVRVRRGRVEELVFDFRPREAAVDVRVFDAEGEPAGDARVVVQGRPDSLRYAKEGTTILHLPKGAWTLAVGAGDRVLEQPLRIDELRAHAVAFHLGRDDLAVFTGCEEAVQPYLEGDLERACEALEAAGRDQAAHVLRAELHRARGETAEAASHYEAAGHLTQAAELVSADEGAVDQSATLFEQAGDFAKAAERWAAAGDHARAAAAWESAYRYDEAIEAWRAAGHPAKVAELLERTGRFFEAAQASLEHGDADAAIRHLQRVEPRETDYAEACRVLAEIFAGREEWSLALEKAREAVEIPGEEAAPLELLDQLGRLLERADRPQDALEVYEGIRKRDFQYPGVAERIEALRQTAADATRRDDAAPTLAAPQRAAADARYEILEEIGRGGMGVVYKARDRRLGRVIALKRLPDNLQDHPTAVQLFLREARSAAALNHPNIVTLFDAGEDETGHYSITMELLEGLPLDAILAKRGRLGVKDTLRLAVQIATGLQYAHERRIVHRDIKTSNLFFTRDRVVKIMDFGLAKMIEEVRRAATVIGGTPYYMAPEQGAGEAVDHRADLYAFGVTLFELLTGGVPFTQGDVAYHHRHTPAPDPRERVPDLPAPLCELILRLMAKRPEDRPATTAEVTAALHRMLQA